VIAAAVGGVYLVGGADVLAVFAYPYGNRTAGAASEIADVVTSISASPTTSYLGGYVNFVVTVAYPGNTYANVLLTVRLSPGMRLAGPPHYLVGSGCSGGSTFVCDIGYLPAGHSTNVYFGAQMTAVSPQTVSAGTTSAGAAGYNHPQVTIPVGR
jgi:hypothetical protein